VSANGPVHGVGDGFEIGEKGDAAFERGEFAGCNGVEAGVFEGGSQGVASQPIA